MNRIKKAMSQKILFIALILFILAMDASGGSWNSIVPGLTDERVTRTILGEPSQIWLAYPERELKTLRYNSDKAPSGTKGVNIIIDQKTLKVKKIDTTPIVKLDMKAIEQLYGKPDREFFEEGLIKIQQFSAQGIEIEYENDNFTVKNISFIPAEKEQPSQ